MSIINRCTVRLQQRLFRICSDKSIKYLHASRNHICIQYTGSRQQNLIKFRSFRCFDRNNLISIVNCSAQKIQTDQTSSGTCIGSFHQLIVHISRNNQQFQNISRKNRILFITSDHKAYFLSSCIRAIHIFYCQQLISTNISCSQSIRDKRIRQIRIDYRFHAGSRSLKSRYKTSGNIIHYTTGTDQRNTFILRKPCSISCIILQACSSIVKGHHISSSAIHRHQTDIIIGTGGKKTSQTQ